MTRSPLAPPPLVYAHRGDRSRADDNTLEAYRLAIDAHADGIELDVRRTKDGVLIVSHDDRLPGLAPHSTLTFDALREMAPHVPTLKEAMDAIAQDVFVNVEIKNLPFDAGFDEDRTIVDETIEELARSNNTDRVLLSSFDAQSMKRAREIDKTILCGLLLVEIMPLESGIEIAAELSLDALVPHFDHLRSNAGVRINEIRRNGLATVVWGVDEPQDVALLAAAHVDAIITDDPTMAVRTIAQR